MDRPETPVSGGLGVYYGLCSILRSSSLKEVRDRKLPFEMCRYGPRVKSITTVVEWQFRTRASSHALHHDLRNSVVVTGDPSQSSSLTQGTSKFLWMRPAHTKIVLRIDNQRKVHMPRPRVCSRKVMQSILTGRDGVGIVTKPRPQYGWTVCQVTEHIQLVKVLRLWYITNF